MAIKRNNEMDKNPLLNDKTEEEIITEELQKTPVVEEPTLTEEKDILKEEPAKESKTIYEQNKDKQFDVAGLYNILEEPLKKTLVNKKPKDFKERYQKQEETLTPTIDKDQQFDVDTRTGKIVMDEPVGEEVLKIFDEDVHNALKETATTENISPKLGNLGNKLDLTDDINLFQKKFYDSYEEVIKKGKGKVTVKQVAKQASALGNWDVIKKVIKTKVGGPPLDLKSTYKSNLILGQLLTHTDSLSKKVNLLRAKNIEELTLAEKKLVIEFKKSLTMTSVMYSKVAGNNANYARGLSILGKLPKASEADIAEFMAKSDTRDTKSIIDAAGYFSELSDPYKKAAFARQSVTGKWRDALITWYVNSLLSSPITQMVNIVSNAGFQAMRHAEYEIAAGYGKIAKHVFGATDDDILHFNNFTRLPSQIKEMTLDGLARGKIGWQKGTAATTKIDMPPNKINRDLLGGYKDTWMGDGMEYLNIGVTLPGRFLTTADEFAKGWIYRMELDRLGREEWNKAFRKSKDSGLSKVGAKAEADIAYINFIEQPPNEAITKIEQSMLEGTFQGELPPIFKQLQNVMNHPNTKFFIPFYKTITNIFLEASKRNPATAALMPSVWKDIMKGGSAKHLALAKLSTGTMLMTTFGMMSLDREGDIRITGKGPTDSKMRKTWFAAGNRPYSIMLKNNKTGKWDIISYSRFEPISALFAISADFAQYSLDPNADMSKGDALVSAALGAIYPYLSQQPFMKGGQDIAKLFGQYNADDVASINRIKAFFAQKAGQIGGGLIYNPTGSLGRFLDHQGDNNKYKKDFNITQEQLRKEQNTFGGDVPLYVQKFYYELNKARQSSVYYSVNPENVVHKTNYFNEKIPHPHNAFYVSPIAIQDVGYDELNIKVIEAGLSYPDPRPNFSGVDLSAQQFRKYKQYYNNNNGELDDNMPPLKDELLEYVNSSEWDKLHKDYEDKIIDEEELQTLLQNGINLICHSYQKGAKDKLLGKDDNNYEDSEFSGLNDMIDEIRKKRAKKPPAIVAN